MGYATCDNYTKSCQWVHILGPAIPIVAISVGLAYEHYGNDD